MKTKHLRYAALLLFLTGFGFSKSYKGAELRTKEAFTYGRFEVRYKPPAGDGFLASFFTYHELENGTEDWNEIDIEILGRYEDNIQFNTITPGQTNHESHQYVPFNPHQDFHTYGFEWTPDYVAWFVDGNEIYRQTGDHIQTLTREQKLMMNIWIPEYDNWVGVWNPQVLPKFAYYDWVSYASYTPGTGDTGTGHNFSFQWKDNFDSWDTNRWDKASHTWNGNATDFVPENVVFQDGNMILCLTNENDLGLVDNSPPYVLWARGNQNKVNLSFSEAVDSVSALKTSSYFINGLTVDKVTLFPDHRTVELGVSPIDSAQDYSMVVLGVKDQSANQNTQMGQVIPITIAKPLSFPLKINAGGGPVYGEFLADQSWGPDKEYGHMDGYSKKWDTANDIAGTEQDSIYFSELNGAVKYKVRVPHGMYSLTLHFAENEFDEKGKRLFKIVAEDSLIADTIDLDSLAGIHSAYDIRIQNIPVADGIMDIHLIDLIGKSILNGLTIEQVSTGLKAQNRVIPTEIELYQNHPNPFNPATRIEYKIAKEAEVRLTVFNTLGQQIAVLVDARQNAGTHRVTFEGTPWPSGIYYYRLQAGKRSETRKMVLLR